MRSRGLGKERIGGLLAIIVGFTMMVATAAVFLTWLSSAEAANPTGADTLESAGLRPFRPRAGHDRPLVAIVAESAGTETTDFIVPYGMLTQSGVAEVITVGTKSGPIQMIPALKIAAETTTSEFDARFPEGSDYLIVPAVMDPADKILLAWVRSQARRGAIVIGICDGAWVLGNAGLLDGHRATGHWYSLDSLSHKFSTTTWVRDRRYVADGNVVTTTGVTASIPLSLALVEAIAGQERAMKLARDVGASDWSPAHNSNDFKFGWNGRLTAARNKLSFWTHESVGIPVSTGTDEIALALVADAYSRTFMSQAQTVSDSKGPVRTRRGLMLIPDVVSGSGNMPTRMLPSFESLPPVQALDWALAGIADAYGQPTAMFVTVQLEYKQSGVP
jgi:putative intracellular protease/amidase